MKNHLPSKSSKSDIDAFVDEIKQRPQVHTGQRGRLLFAMDATASRAPTWDRACQIQGSMFESTAEIGHLDVQLAYYRGYNEFQTSAWHSHPETLLRDMTAVGCMGGLTQIERILQQALDETQHKKVHAVVFVGDCVEEDVDRLCHLAGQLGVYHVPLFIFHEGNDAHARSAFQQMTHLSGGAYCAFDQSSAEQLKTLLSAVAVYAVGGKKALENYSRNKGDLPKLLTKQLQR